MKHPIAVIIAMLAMIVAFASAAFAQTTPPCKPLAQDRSITFCYPVDDANLSVDTVLEWGWIKDSLPHTAKMYFDGQYMVDPPDIFNGGHDRVFDDKLHTLTIVVTDSQGSFQKSASFRQTLQLPCALPSTDKTVAFCKPSNSEIGPSPVRVAAVARSSIGISWVQVWIDGTKPVDSTQHTTGTAEVKMLNQYYYLANGTHTIAIVAKQTDGTSIKATHNVKVASYAP